MNLFNFQECLDIITCLCLDKERLIKLNFESANDEEPLLYPFSAIKRDMERRERHELNKKIKLITSR